MSEKNITTKSASRLKKGRSDIERLRKMSDKQIAAAVRNDPNAVPLDIDWSDAELVAPPSKTPVSIRLDRDVVRYFKAMGPGYQTRINNVLRHYVEQKKQSKESSG